MVFNLFFGRKTWKKGLFSPYFARSFSDHFGVFSEKSVKIVHFYPSVFLQKLSPAQNIFPDIFQENLLH